MTAVKVVIMRRVPTEFDVWSCSQVMVGVGTMLTLPCIKPKEIQATVYAAMIHFAVRLARQGRREGKGKGRKEGEEKGEGKRREEYAQEKSRAKGVGG